jgi:bleomycin hydrolase
MNSKPILIAVLVLFLVVPFVGQYEISDKFTVECTSVKNQQRSGTCWSFATCSFVEAEIIRLQNKSLDLSEMFVVRNMYKEKAWNYILRQGKANFGQGSLGHDFIRSIGDYGVVPESVYNGKPEGISKYDHSEMEAALKGMLEGLVKIKPLSDRWDEAFEGVLTAYLGDVDPQFVYEGKTYTPKSLAKSLTFNPADYLQLTSYSHHPYYESFVLEIPDNTSNGSYFNLPVDKLESVVDEALKAGYTVAWDGDASNKSFSQKYGLAILPVDIKREDLFTVPGEEVSVNQINRQRGFESYETTDDHLMHFIGMGVDNEGNEYYKVKNSWGIIGEYDGYLYMSKPYFRMNTIAVFVHKDGVSDSSLKNN